jgi:tRNA pseudouridine32 synthase/23S rRNA pseudouridine746 synthase
MYKIIEDHRDFLVISKDAGVCFHRKGEAAGLVDTVRSDCGLDELYTVHRLDTMTSGLLLFAKNRGGAQQLTAQFRKKIIRKYYLAISDRRPRKKQGLILGDMIKARRGAWKLTRTRQDPAITQFFSTSLGNRLRLFLLRPLTGRTHQVRVAMKSIGSPVLGDPLYHKKEDTCIDRGYLHSYAVSFTLHGRIFRITHKPDTGRYFLDEAFLEVVKRYEHPWELDWPEIKKS